MTTEYFGKFAPSGAFQDKLISWFFVRHVLHLCCLHYLSQPFFFVGKYLQNALCSEVMNSSQRCFLNSENRPKTPENDRRNSPTTFPAVLVGQTYNSCRQFPTCMCASTHSVRSQKIAQTLLTRDRYAIQKSSRIDSVGPDALTKNLLRNALLFLTVRQMFTQFFTGFLCNDVTFFLELQR